MRKILIMILVLIILVFSGCGGKINPLSGQNADKMGVKVDDTGYGLEISLDMNSDPTLIKSKKVKPKLSFVNSGKEPITISKENFQIYTVEKLQNGNNVISQSSLDAFYQKIFDGNSLTLYQNQEKNNIGGILIIEDEYFNSINKNKFTYILKTNYDYETSFSNNMILNLESSTKLDVKDLSQAAPIKIVDVKLEDGLRKSEYEITFKIRNEKRLSLQNYQTIAKIKNFEFYFNTQSLTDCVYLDYEGNLIKNSNLILNDLKPEINVICKLNLAQYESEKNAINGKVSGKITYNYEIESSGEISLGDRTKSNNFN